MEHGPAAFIPVLKRLPHTAPWRSRRTELFAILTDAWEGGDRLPIRGLGEGVRWDRWRGARRAARVVQGGRRPPSVRMLAALPLRVWYGQINVWRQLARH